MPHKLDVSNLVHKKSLGAVYTKLEVAELMLNMVGYTVGGQLWKKRLLEPSCGDGVFVLAALERLWADLHYHNMLDDLPQLEGCFCVVELHPPTFEATRNTLERWLLAKGLGAVHVQHLLNAWLHHADALLLNDIGTFDVVVGNPPYVRQKALSSALRQEYAGRYRTMSKQADIYIGFFEMGLSRLGAGGKLAYICADRWIKNRYGQALRQHIQQHHSVEACINMQLVQPFAQPVDAYPAVVLIGPKTSNPTYYAQCTTLERSYLSALAQDGTASQPMLGSHVQLGQGPYWYFATGVADVMAKLDNFTTLERCCRVGIGVATGADAVFVRHHSLDIEETCKLPLVMPADLGAELVWGGMVLVNPYTPDGGLLDLDTVPRTKAYLLQHQQQLLQRYCVKRPDQWYKTIDKPKLSLLCTPKLLIPDIKQRLCPVLDEGGYYPHHNLYHITSSNWDLKALRTLLSGSVVQWWMRLRSTAMRNGHYRFQAQYLKRIPLPDWSKVPTDIQQQLIAGLDCSQQLYGLTLEQMTLIKVS